MHVRMCAIPHLFSYAWVYAPMHIVNAAEMSKSVISYSKLFDSLFLFFFNQVKIFSLSSIPNGKILIYVHILDLFQFFFDFFFSKVKLFSSLSLPKRKKNKPSPVPISTRLILILRWAFPLSEITHCINIPQRQKKQRLPCVHNSPYPCGLTTFTPRLQRGRNSDSFPQIFPALIRSHSHQKFLDGQTSRTMTCFKRQQRQKVS